MERKTLIIGFFTIAITCVLSIGALSLFPQIHEKSIEIYANNPLYAKENTSVISLLRDEFVAFGMGESNGHNLRLELPGDVDSQHVSMEKDILHQQVLLTIPGLTDTYFQDFPMVGSSNHISEITFDTKDQVGYIAISLDGLYETNMTMDGRLLYLDFLNPKDIYRHIIVVDAGHGGKDAGANRKNLKEKDINLEMLLALKEKFEAENNERIGVYYTRTEDVSMNLDSRVDFANRLGADLFLSIHQNSTASGRQSYINGTEVMYQSSDSSGMSKEFSKRCLDHLLSELGSSNKGLVAADDILIVRKAQMPVALAEVGFLTNPDEVALLQSKEYQKLVAKALYDAVMESL